MKPERLRPHLSSQCLGGPSLTGLPRLWHHPRLGPPTLGTRRNRWQQLGRQHEPHRWAAVPGHSTHTPTHTGYITHTCKYIHTSSHRLHHTCPHHTHVYICSYRLHYTRSHMSTSHMHIHNIPHTLTQNTQYTHITRHIYIIHPTCTIHVYKTLRSLHHMQTHKTHSPADAHTSNSLHHTTYHNAHITPQTQHTLNHLTHPYTAQTHTKIFAYSDISTLGV